MKGILSETSGTRKWPIYWRIEDILAKLRDCNLVLTSSFRRIFEVVGKGNITLRQSLRAIQMS